MKKYFVTLSFVLMVLSVASAQPKVTFDNIAPHRNEFISYSIRDFAVKRDRAAEPYAIELKNLSQSLQNGSTLFTATVEIPDVWTERELFLHTEGSRNSHKVYVNDILIGSARDSRLPSEFRISPAIRSGRNTVTIEVVPDEQEPEAGIAGDKRPLIDVAYIHTQPRVRVKDFTFTSALDSLGEYGLFRINVTIENGFNSDEPIAVGFDLYTPEGDLKEYLLREIVVSGNSTSDITLETMVWGAPKRLWSAENPKLYDVMLFVRRGKFYTEYIPIKVGFGQTLLTDRGIERNGRLIDIKAANFNAGTTAKETEKSIAALKKQGVNTIYVDYPQPGWFYDICDRLGMYVVDQANINTSREGRALSNDPLWLGEFMGRVEGMYYRNRNHVCIIGRSLGGDSGNGYNMYRVYRWLKEQTPDQAVVYRYSGNQWNNDIDLPAPTR